MLHLLAALSWPTYPHVKLGPLSISPHGVGIAVGFILGARLMLPAAERKGIGENDVYPLLTRAAVGAIVGARIAYVLNHLTDDSVLPGGYLHNPLAIFKVWEGGISLLGGFVGAIALAMPEMRKRRLSFWQVMDAAAPGMALGVIIGRIGDLVVGDHLGKPTGLFFGFKCPGKVTATASDCLPGHGVAVHQTALYDFVLSIILLAVLLWLRRTRRYDGFLITVFGIWYGCQRILEDFLRADKHVVPGLTGSQVTAIITVLVCLWHLRFVHRTPQWGRWDERPLGLPDVEPADDSGADDDRPGPEGMTPAPTSLDAESPTEE